MNTIIKSASMLSLLAITLQAQTARAECNAEYDRQKASCEASTNGSWRTSWTGNGWQEWKGSAILEVKNGSFAELAVSAEVNHNTCNGIEATSTAEVTTTRTDSTSYDFGIELGTEVKAEINTKILASLGISGTRNFKAGYTKTTEISEERKHTAEVKTGPYKITKTRLVIMGMKNGQVKLAVYREKLQWARCCFDSWTPFDEYCPDWTRFVCERESKETWTTPANQHLSQVMQDIRPVEPEKPCPSPSPSPSPNPTTPPPTTSPAPSTPPPPPPAPTTSPTSGGT